MRPTRTTPLFGLPLATGLAALSGLVMALAFAPFAFAPYAIVAVALLTASLWGARLRRGLGLGYLAGLVFFGLLLGWMHVIGWDVWLLLAAFWALWLALLGFGTVLVTRLPGAPVWVAAVWVLDEAARARMPFGGFPWGNIAFGQADGTFARYAALGGTPLVTFAVAFAGASIVTVVLDYRAGRRRLATAWFAVAAAMTLLPGLIPIPGQGDSVGGPDSAIVAIVQGGTPQVGMGAMDVRRAVLDNHVAQTMRLAESIDSGETPRPAFVLWPENSSDIDPFTDSSVADAITAAARAVGVPILVGAVVTAPEDPDNVMNVGILWDPVTGPQRMYVKNHPVPFGEYIPFRDFLAEHVGRLDRIPRDFVAGDVPGNMGIGGVAVGDVICFEVAYNQVVRNVIEGGARIITVQTNNATYGGTAQPDQQLAIERMRAVEFGRSVIVASTSGVSAMITPQGYLDQHLGQGEVGYIVEEMPLRGELNLAARIGPTVELLLCLIAVGALVAGAVRSPRLTA